MAIDLDEEISDGHIGLLIELPLDWEVQEEFEAGGVDETENGIVLILELAEIEVCAGGDFGVGGVQGSMDGEVRLQLLGLGEVALVDRLVPVQHQKHRYYILFT